MDKTPVPGLSESSSFTNGETLAMPVCPSCGMKMAHGTIKCPNDGTEIVTKYKVGDCLNNKYEFLESVGSGGMGIIYKAKHLALNRIVAIKLLHPYLLNAETIMRFQREARTASQLRHPNLIAVQDVGTMDDGQPYMVMDFVSGKSLSEAIKEKGRLSVQETVGIFLQLCSGLAYAHKQNILHRDLKPSNVMLVEDEQGGVTAKILDFGIAKVLEDGDKQGSTLTKTGDVFGSPLYMSPEQGAGEKVDRRSDCYSLGCMLFECLTGTTPFMGRSIIETLLAHAQQKPPSLKEATLGLDFPEALGSVVSKLLAKSPDERYQSVLEVREDLLAVHEAFSTDSSDSSFSSKRELRQLASGEGTTSDGTSKVKTFWTTASGKDFTIILLSMAVVVLIGKDVWMSYSSSEDKSKPKIDFDKQYEVKLARDTNSASSVQKKIERDPGAEVFRLSDQEVSDSDLKPLANHRKIIELHLDSNILSGTGLEVAKTLPRLRKLSVSDNPLTEKGVLVISQLSQIRNLEIKGVRLSAQSVSYLGQMKNLVKLEMDECELADKSLGNLSSMPSLEELSINNQRQMSDRSIELLRNLPKLRLIDVSKTKVTGRGFELPGRFPQLSIVVLKENELEEDGFKVLGRLKNLKELDLRGSKFKESWLNNLRDARFLKILKVSGDADIKQIQKILPGCRIATD